jgi:hypothetical protein
VSNKPHPPFFFTMASSTQAQALTANLSHDIVVKAIVRQRAKLSGRSVIVKPVCSRTRLFKMAIVAASPTARPTRDTFKAERCTTPRTARIEDRLSLPPPAAPMKPETIARVDHVFMSDIWDL